MSSIAINDTCTRVLKLDQHGSAEFVVDGDGNMTSLVVGRGFVGNGACFVHRKGAADTILFNDFSDPQVMSIVEADAQMGLFTRRIEVALHERRRRTACGQIAYCNDVIAQSTSYHLVALIAYASGELIRAVDVGHEFAVASAAVSVSFTADGTHVVVADCGLNCIWKFMVSDGHVVAKVAMPDTYAPFHVLAVDDDVVVGCTESGGVGGAVVYVCDNLTTCRVKCVTDACPTGLAVVENGDVCVELNPHRFGSASRYLRIIPAEWTGTLRCTFVTVCVLQEGGAVYEEMHTAWPWRERVELGPHAREHEETEDSEKIHEWCM